MVNEILRQEHCRLSKMTRNWRPGKDEVLFKRVDDWVYMREIP